MAKSGLIKVLPIFRRNGQNFRRPQHALKTKEQKTETEKKKLEETNARIQQKLENFQELYDSNQRLIYLGNKINDISEKYFQNKTQKGADRRIP